MENNIQKIRISEDGEILVETGKATISSKNENQPIARLQGTYEMEAEDVAKLIAMTKQTTFLGFLNNFCMITSEEDVKNQLSEIKEMVENDMKDHMESLQELEEEHEKYKAECEKITADCEERLKAANKLVDTTDNACKFAEKYLTEEREKNAKLEMQIKAFNEMPFLKRLFKNIVL